MKRAKIKHLLAEGEVGSEVLVMGWVKTRRGSKKFSFVVLNDGSCPANLQIVVDNSKIDADTLKQVTTGASVAVRGHLAESGGKEQAYELQAESIEVYGEAPADTYPLQKKGHTLEFLRGIAHLRSRSTTFGCVFRLRSAMAYAIHHYFYERGFYYIHTPIITASDCEGAGEMFQVTTLDLAKLPAAEGATDFARDFFERPAHLTVSGQLNAELAALGLGEVYTFGPTFRAENSNTARHLAEFWMIEPEMAFYDLQDNMELAQDFLRYLVEFALKNNADDIAWLEENQSEGLTERLRSVLTDDFVRLPYTEAIEILEGSGQDFEYSVSWGVDLQSSTSAIWSNSISASRSWSSITRANSKRFICG